MARISSNLGDWACGLSRRCNLFLMWVTSLPGQGCGSPLAAAAALSRRGLRRLQLQGKGRQRACTSAPRFFCGLVDGLCILTCFGLDFGVEGDGGPIEGLAGRWLIQLAQVLHGFDMGPNVTIGDSDVVDTLGEGPMRVWA